MPTEDKNQLIRTLIDCKNIQVADVKILDEHILEISDLTELQLADIPFGSLAPIRQEGRPKKGVFRERTTTQSFRFTIGFLAFLKSIARVSGMTMTRYVEEAVMLKATTHIASSSHHYSPSLNKQRASYVSNDNFEIQMDPQDDRELVAA